MEIDSFPDIALEEASVTRCRDNGTFEYRFRNPVSMVILYEDMMKTNSQTQSGLENLKQKLNHDDNRLGRVPGNVIRVTNIKVDWSK